MKKKRLFFRYFIKISFYPSSFIHLLRPQLLKSYQISSIINISAKLITTTQKAETRLTTPTINATISYLLLINDWFNYIKIFFLIIYHSIFLIRKI